jgi:hypothetical protein
MNNYEFVDAAENCYPYCPPSKEAHLAYVEVKYYRSYAIEVREFGDAGWAAHVYAPRTEQRAKKVAIIATRDANGLEEILSAARGAVDKDLGTPSLQNRA